MWKFQKAFKNRNSQIHLQLNEIYMDFGITTCEHRLANQTGQ